MSWRRIGASSRASLASRRGTIRIALDGRTVLPAMNHTATLKVNGRDNFLIVSELERASENRLPERPAN